MSSNTPASQRRSSEVAPTPYLSAYVFPTTAAPDAEEGNWGIHASDDVVQAFGADSADGVGLNAAQRIAASDTRDQDDGSITSPYALDETVRGVEAATSPQATPPPAAQHTFTALPPQLDVDELVRLGQSCSNRRELRVRFSTAEIPNGDGGSGGGAAAFPADGPPSDFHPNNNSSTSHAYPSALVELLRSDGTDLLVSDHGEEGGEDEDDSSIMADFDADAEELEPYSVITRIGVVHISLNTQLLALVQRTARQYRRHYLSVLAEILSPLLFVVLLIILNVAFGTNPVAQTIYTSPKVFSYQLNVLDYTTYMCYNDSAKPIAGLVLCTDIPFTYTCDGDETGIPVSGLCYAYYSSAAKVVAQYLSNMLGTAISAPALDSIIVHQWVAKKASLAEDSRSRTALAALSSVGIGESGQTRYDSISYSGLLYFAPAANVPEALLTYFRTQSVMFDYVYGGTFDTVAEAEKAIKSSNATQASKNSVWGLIVIDDITDAFDVTIRLHSDALPALSPMASVQYRSGFLFDGTDMYLASGFVSLQKVLYDYFYSTKASNGDMPNVKSGALTAYTPDNIYTVISSFPSIKAETPYLFSLASSLAAFILVLSFLYPFSQMTKRLVLEKELRIRESMCIMGLKRSALWLNCFLAMFLEYVVICIALTVLLCAVVTTRSSSFSIFLILFVYALTLVPLSCLLSVFFGKARMAAIMSPLIYFVLSMPIFAMGTANRSTVIGLSVFSPTGLASLMTSVFTAESGRGFQSSDFHNSYFVAKPYIVMIVIACDVALYLLLMVYLDLVLPQEWGTHKHPLFFVSEPYAWWTQRRRRAEEERARSYRETASSGSGWVQARSRQPLVQSNEISTSNDRVAGGTNGGSGVVRVATNASSRNAGGGRPFTRGDTTTAIAMMTPSSSVYSAPGFDPTVNRDIVTGQEKTVGVRVCNVSKYFVRNGTPFAAVNDVSWNMYRDEISVLLGPNGAGKSTTINMITGMLAADSGDCFIEGHSVSLNTACARHEIGYCPQHNILWPDLTCREHLEFYGKIKGLHGADLEDAVVDILRAVDLEEKMNSAPTAMSGGQKRKLSVAIAFVGRNRVILLDEPTAGMDPAARRHTWSLLRAMAGQHTILLTTHYMDEADLLGDNVAIVTDGVLQCAGTTQFLRRYAGVGYTLHFDLALIPAQHDDEDRAAKVASVWAKLNTVVSGQLADARLALRTDAEVDYELPQSAESCIPNFLREMEKLGNKQLGIRGYALRAPTLEDVFLRVVEHQVPSTEVPSPQQESAKFTSLCEEKHEPSEQTGTANAVSPKLSTSANRAVEGVVATSALSSVTPLHRRMSRASVRFYNNETRLNYGNDVEPSDQDEDVNMDVVLPFEERHNDAPSAWYTGSGGGLGLVSVTKNQLNDSGTGYPRQRRGLGIPASPGAPDSAPRLTWLSPDTQNAAAATGATPTTKTGRNPKRELQLDREALLDPAAANADTASGSSDGLVSDTPTVAAQVRVQNGDVRALEKPSLPFGTPSDGQKRVALPPPHQQPQSQQQCALGDATAALDNGTAAAAAAAAARTEGSLYKHVTDRHLDHVWATRLTTNRQHLWLLQLRGMMYKRFFCAIRDKRMLFFQIICPVFCILLAMLLQLVKNTNHGTVVMTPLAFQSPTSMEVSGCTPYTGPASTLNTYSTARYHMDITDPNFVSATDMSYQLLDTWDVHARPRYSSLQCNDPNIQFFMTYNYPDSLGSRTVSVVLYNTSSRHSLPLSLHINYALAYFAGMGDASSTFKMRVSSLPVSSGSTVSQNAIGGILIGIIVLIPFTFLPANPVAWVVKEYESRARNLQTVSGLRYLIYWSGNFLFDFAAYVVSIVLVMIIFVIFQRSEYIGYDTIGPTILAFALYGLCYCCGAYMVSFFFYEHTTAQLVVLGVSFLTGFLCVMLVFVLSLLDKTVDASNTLRWIFRVLPPYSIGEVILNLALLKQKQLTDDTLTAWSMSITVWPDIYMAAEIPIFATVTLLWDHPNRRAVLERLRAAFLCCGGGESSKRERCAKRRDAGAVVESNHIPAAETQRAELSEERVAVTPAAARRGSTAPQATTPFSTSGGGRVTGSNVFIPTSISPNVAAAAAASPALRRRRNSSSSGANSMSKVLVTETGAATVAQQQQRQHLSGDVLIRATDPATRDSQVELPTALYDANNTYADASTPTHCAASPTRSGLVGADLSVQLQGDPSNLTRTMPSNMIYRPPLWYRVDDTLRGGEDSDVEEERDAVYREEHQYVEEQQQLQKQQRHTTRQTTHRSSGSGAVISGETPENHHPHAPTTPYHEQSQSGADAIRVVDLRKVYDQPHKVAVSDLAFSVMHGEVFAFLGTNGAGKSTALSILTQEQLPTSGRAYVCGHDVVRDSVEAAGNLGYCPQFDACLDLLTVAEHLRLYALVRGVAVDDVEALVESIVTICNLTAHQDVLSSDLSGGNRRKLSVAIALIGAPKVVCLDEPTAGLDPLARRLLWRALDRISCKCSIILTTHHLEEVEALADCVGIMVEGGLRCFGDLPHLKHKYARSAYELTIWVSPARKRALEKQRQQQILQSQQLQKERETASSISPSQQQQQRRRSRRESGVATNQSTSGPNETRRHASVSYAGADIIDTTDDIFQFMLRHFPSALLVDNFNNERYVYTLPATHDVASAMLQLQHRQQRHGSISYGNQASVRNSFSAAGLRSGSVTYPIVRLSDVFDKLQASQETLGITEYSVSQVSLEQVFLRVCSDNRPRRYRHHPHRQDGRRCSHGGDTVAQKTPIAGARTTTHSPSAAAAAAAQAGLAAASVRSVRFSGHLAQPRQRRGSSIYLSSMYAGAPPTDAASPSHRRLSVRLSGLPSVAPVRMTFADYRRQRAMLRLRGEEQATQPNSSEVRRTTEPDHNDSS